MLEILAQFIRFVGIGFLNTAVGLAVFNILAFYFHQFTGIAAGVFTIASFLIAVTHSYFWNRFLVFGRTPLPASLSADLSRFAVAGLMGALVILATYYGAAKQYDYIYYLAALALLAIAEMVFWFVFRLGENIPAEKSSREFALFIAITAIGAIIQFTLTTVITGAIPPRFGINQELWTNLAYAAATGASLVWNFLGYKILLFKK